MALQQWSVWYDKIILYCTRTDEVPQLLFTNSDLDFTVRFGAKNRMLQNFYLFINKINNINKFLSK